MIEYNTTRPHQSCGGRPPAERFRLADRSITPDDSAAVPPSAPAAATAAGQIFAGLPPGAVRTSWQKQPAKYHNRGIFGGSGWSGPDITLTFTSSQSARDVFRFYAKLAHETGWTPSQAFPNGLTWDWSKHIAGKQSHIVLKGPFDLNSMTLIPYVNVDWTESGTPRSYSLNTY